MRPAGNDDSTRSPATHCEPRQRGERALVGERVSFTHCAGCGSRLSSDAIAATVTGRAGVSLDFCQQCSAGQAQLNLKHFARKEQS